MRKNTYQKKMENHKKSFDKLWKKIVNDTNDFIEKNPEISLYSFQDIEKFTDNMCLSGAWVQDRLNGKSPFVHKKGSLTRKIKKSLGYNIL